jgi:hypothetical protein
VLLLLLLLFLPVSHNLRSSTSHRTLPPLRPHRIVVIPATVFRKTVIVELLHVLLVFEAFALSAAEVEEECEAEDGEEGDTTVTGWCEYVHG